MNHSQRRDALIRACEYDRLQIRLACVRAELDHARSVHAQNASAVTRTAAVAQTVFRFLPVGDLVKIAARIVAKR